MSSVFRCLTVVHAEIPQHQLVWQIALKFIVLEERSPCTLVLQHFSYSYHKTLPPWNISVSIEWREQFFLTNVGDQIGWHVVLRWLTYRSGPQMCFTHTTDAHAISLLYVLTSSAPFSFSQLAVAPSLVLVHLAVIHIFIPCYQPLFTFFFGVLIHV